MFLPAPFPPIAGFGKAPFAYPAFSGLTAASGVRPR